MRSQHERALLSGRHDAGRPRGRGSARERQLRARQEPLRFALPPPRRLVPFRWIQTLLLFVMLPAASPVAAQLPPPGFATTRADSQRALESIFLSGFSADSARTAVRMLSTGPVLSGTPAAHEQAELLAERLRRLGFHVRLERFEPWLPHPVDIGARLVAPDTLTFSMREPSAGSGAQDTAAALWNWLAYAANGVAEAPVVYANFGLPSDYATLAEAGIDVRGAIVLARLGRAYRGVKIFEAQARGAAGVILFADPAADGFIAGDTFPDGPYRPSWSVQRGTVAAMWRLTGDPLTPGSPAFIRARRIDPANAINLPDIPAVTIGYGDASAILARLEGPRLDGFDGGLEVAYRTGPGPARMHIRNQQAYARRPILHVIATLPGEEDRPVILGNHFDAWVSGGADPHIGTAAVLEIARGLARLRRQGWQPRRSIVLAFWDAEEFGVVGSTEWVEAHIQSLSNKATAYFNIDTFTAGTLDVTGSPALLDLVRSAADAVDDPVTGRTVAQEWAERADGTPEIGDIGAGSDWTAFLHHAGVPSLQWTMNGRGTYAVYHSSLDTSEYVERFVDPDLQHTPVLASVMGLALLRLADADAAPFRYSYHAARIRRHLEQRERDAAEAGLVLETATLRVALERFGTAALAAEAAADAALGNGDAGVWQRIDAVLPRIEGAFLDPAGLPGRPWYRHLLNAPGEDTGYDALPLPAVAEAIRRGDAEAARRAVGDVAAALGRATVMLERLIRPTATR